jgi:hypothetical protein
LEVLPAELAADQDQSWFPAIKRIEGVAKMVARRLFTKPEEPIL